MKIRNLKEGKIYHIYNRGVRKTAIFNDSEDYLFLILKMINLKRKKQLTIFDFCIMPNHFHILIKDKKNTSSFLQTLQLSYTKYFNHKYNLSGSIFQGRYKHTFIKDEFDYARITKYIQNNPVKDKLVKNNKDWTFSSINIKP